MIKKRHYKGTIIILILLSAVTFLGLSEGITGVTLKNGSGCNCHGSSSSNVVVTIYGPDKLSPNQTAQYIVSIKGGPLIAGGTNIASSEGDLNIITTDLQKIGTELTHTAPKSATADSVFFAFNYTAPAEMRSVTLFANGNSVNRNNNNSGDQWNFALSKLVQVENAVSVDDDMNNLTFSLKQNYPNPFNPQTVIDFTLPESGVVNLKLFNILGTELAEVYSGMRDAGFNSLTVNASKYNLTSGTYFYKLDFKGLTQNFSESRKMILLK